MGRVTVRSWPTYLLTDLPPELRQAITEEAAAGNLSVAETVRQILCARYRLECEPVRQYGDVGYVAERDQGNRTILLRVSPALFSRIRAHSARFTRRKKSMRALIVEALEDHYERRAA